MLIFHEFINRVLLLNKMASTNASDCSKTKRVWGSIHCSHCDQMVSKSTYYRHRAKSHSLSRERGARPSLLELPQDQFHQDDHEMHEEFVQTDLDLEEEPGSSSSESMDDTEQRTSDDRDKEFFSDCSCDEAGSEIEQEPNSIEVWSSSDDSDTASDIDLPNQSNFADFSMKVFHLLFVFILLWQATYNVSSAAVGSLLRFLKYFILHLGKAFQCHLLVQASSSLPLTTVAMNKLVGINNQSFIEYVVCPKCSCIFEYNDCIVIRNGKKESKRCCHVEYPNHPQISRRAPCGTVLLKSCKTKKGTILMPIKVYPYRPLKTSISNFLKRPGFIEKCEHWRTRASAIPEDYLGDIYDGDIWNKYCSSEYGDFLKTPHSYLLTLNIDWFQPFVRTVYSTGAIYLTIQNLPRDERYKQKNVILVGVIPGPKEPKLNINSYLTPLVEELQAFWSGIIFPLSINGNLMHIRVRIALSCVACDIPASRKVCGFVGHNATLGCSKCLKEFPVIKTSGSQRTDYSGYDRQSWKLRTNEDHRKSCALIAKEVTPSAAHKAESKYGARYSIFLALPYFDPITYTVVDPMHNLFLGTGKHVFKVWIDNGLLSTSDLSQIESRLSKFNTPMNVGRLPSNIASSYNSYTANQWSNWITIYSAVLLKNILPNEHLRCWLLFVRACSILRSNTLKKQDLITADLLLVQFCHLFQNLYGADSCTPNMHLHLHLKQCLLDYGPSHAFWCYAFERYNGILGSVHTNRRAIESQLMRKFCQEQDVDSIDTPLVAEVRQFLPQTSQPAKSIMTELTSEDHMQNLLKIGYSPLENISTFALHSKVHSLVKVLNPYEEKYLESSLVKHLQSVYEQLYPGKRIAHMSYYYREYGRVYVAGEMIGSVKPGPNNKSSSVVMAYWPGSGDSLANIDYNRMRVGIVQYFVKHCLKVYKETSSSETETLEHLFAYIHWKKLHPESSWFGISTTVSTDLIETPSPCSFLPVQRIGSRCAYALLPVTFSSHTETVFITCPISLSFIM